MKDPIDNIKWIDANSLKANHYNPNVVYNQELKLLGHSILTNGWIQPVLINSGKVIIDGFHRWKLSCDSKQLIKKYKGKVPCAVLKISDEEAMLLTIRINRAKGTHVGFKMAEVVSQLVKKHKLSREVIAKGIGAKKAEIDLLCQENVFTKKDIKNYKYSKAWYPVEKRKK